MDGDRLWFVDSETSSLRWVRRSTSAGGAAYHVGTTVGRGLFDFGFTDGPADEALLQHPLGVTVLADATIMVCDTYNGAVRHVDPVTSRVTTVADGLAEPSSALVDGADLVVIESAAHRLTRVRRPERGQAGRRTDGFAHTTARATTVVAADV